MKIEVSNEPKREPKPFPKLMIAEDGEILLMTNPTSGTVINDVCIRVGLYSDAWAPECFTDFTGTITLQND